VRRPLPPPWALTAITALVYALVAPPTTDLAAQSHRVGLARDGVWLFDLSWFGGHHLPGYSVLMPLLGLLAGPAVIAAVSAVAASAAFGRLVRPAWPGGPGAVADWWFAAGVGGLLFTGRTTFVLGTALGLATVLVAGGGVGRDGTSAATAAHSAAAPATPTTATAPPATATAARTATATPPPSATAVAGRHVVRRAELGGAGAVLTALASPVAALFLAMAAGAWWIAGLRRAGGPGGAGAVPVSVAAAAFGAAAALSAAFPTGGSEPFVASALWPAVVVLTIVLVVLPRDQRALRVGVALYLAGVVLSGLLSTPMGGNATRLAALAGGPLVAGALWGRRPVVLALLALPLVWWQWYPPVRDATQAWGDPSTNAAYWAPIRSDVEGLLAEGGGRVEVVPTARRGEARWMPPEVPLARGWIRQLDRDRSPLFYDDLDGPPSAAAYRAWLDDEAVSWIVLTDAAPDHASEDEAALLRSGRVPGVRPVRAGRHWRVWRVERPRAIASWATGSTRGSAGGAGTDAASADTAGAATTSTPTPAGGPAPRVLRNGPRSVAFSVPRAGLVDLRIRWSPYLRARGERGASTCVARGPGGWTLVRAAGPGTVTVDAVLAAPWRRPGPEDCDA
jgi:hypothetical protein